MHTRQGLSGALGSLAIFCLVAVVVYEKAAPSALLEVAEPPRFQSLYGGHHWGGVGSEGYGSSSWDNSGWNSHYHPRDGASMDSESMEPYTWRKGPRVNDEYTGMMASGDPTVEPPDSWEPPINLYKSPTEILVERPAGMNLVSGPALAMLPVQRRQMQLHSHWGGVGSEGYGTSSWDNSGWNAHYHPRDGASMDSESMEPYFWRKGPRVNDEYTGHMADGDPVFNPPDDWEPPINFY